MTKGKKFIDKKKAVTYRLIPAETNSDENAPKYTFVPVSKGKKLSSFFPPSLLPSKVPDETESPSVAPPLPSLPEGLEPGWDPDVARALDDDFDFDQEGDILEDDFIAKANADVIGSSRKRERYDSDVEDSDENESIDLCDNLSDDDGAEDCYQRNSEYSQYSMTSAVENCSESLKAFNEKFEKFLDLYDDDEIGALDLEDIVGQHSPEELQIQELISKKDEEVLVLGNYDDTMKKKILHLADQPETYVEIVIKQPPTYDCESIRSTYSNSCNLPAVIKSEPKISARTLKKKLTKSNLKKLDEEVEETNSDDESCDHRSVATTCNIRPKNETSEEKKLRKKIVKEARKENRAIKKENKKAFKLEKMRQGMQQINAWRNAGVKIS